MTSQPADSGRPVIRDKRRIDPDTGEIRNPQAAADSGQSAPAAAGVVADAGSPPAAELGTDADADFGSAAGSPAATYGSDVEAALAERTADLQRLQAEYVNYKRRVDRDREVTRDAAKVSVLTALLPVLDDLGRAREHEELRGGFKAVAESLERTVTSQGLMAFGEVGDEFDPHRHEALMHRYSDEVSRPVCQAILQVGYQFGERVVRPARVAVAEPAERSNAEPAAAGSAEPAAAGSAEPRVHGVGGESSEAAASESRPAAGELGPEEAADGTDGTNDGTQTVSVEGSGSLGGPSGSESTGATGHGAHTS